MASRRRRLLIGCLASWLPECRYCSHPLCSRRSSILMVEPWSLIWCATVLIHNDQRLWLGQTLLVVRRSEVRLNQKKQVKYQETIKRSAYLLRSIRMVGSHRSPSSAKTTRWPSCWRDRCNRCWRNRQLSTTMLSVPKRLRRVGWQRERVPHTGRETTDEKHREHVWKAPETTGRLC